MKGKKITGGILCLIFLIQIFLMQIPYTMTAKAEDDNEYEILYATSFEDESDETWLSSATSYDTAEKHSGEKSLKYNRSETGGAFVSKVFMVTPGSEYSISCWVKTADIVYTDPSKEWGPTVAVELVDNVGTWSSASLYPNVKSAEEWTKIDSGLFAIPEKIVKMTVVLYLPSETIGTVWFDDLEIKAHYIAPEEQEEEDPAPEPGENAILIEKIDFEEDISEDLLFSFKHSDGSRIPIIYDNSVAYSGERSLKLERPNPDEYILISKEFEIKPETKYYASCMVKRDNISPGGLACIVMEWFNADDVWVGGTQYAAATGTSEWKKVAVESAKLPENAAKACVTMFITRGATGEAWFDDLEIYEYIEVAEILTTTLISPGYRGLLWDGGTEEIKLIAGLNSADFNLEEYKMRFELIDSEGISIFEKEEANVSEIMEFSYKAADIQAGKYTLRTSVIETETDTIKDFEEWDIEKLDSPDNRPLSYTDKYGRFILNDQPFFPLGLYTGQPTKSDIEVISDSPFNTILPYTAPSNENLDYMNEKGLKLIYSLKDYYLGLPYCPPEIKSISGESIAVKNKVNEYKDHPALLAWYINDELSPLEMGGRLKTNYNAVKENDYNHPTYIVDNPPSRLKYHLGLTDIIGTDPYAVYGKEDDALDMVAKWTRETSDSFPNRSNWAVVQLHNLANYSPEMDWRAPNYEEVRSMSWQSIIEGATGLIYYSFFDLKNDAGGVEFAELWGNAKEVAGEIKDMVPIIMSVDSTPVVTVEGGDWLNWTVRNYQDKTYIIAANNQKDGGKQAIFKVQNAAEVKVLNEDRILDVNTAQGSFSDNFDALAVNIYEIKRQTVTPPTPPVTPSTPTTPPETSEKPKIVVEKDKEGNVNVKISEIKVDDDRLPVIDMSTLLDEENIEWNNPDSPVTIIIDYTLAEEYMKDAEYLTVNYIDEKGNSLPIPNAKYNVKNGSLSFITTKAGKFEVVLEKKTFTDAGKLSWAQKPIEVLVSKGIIDRVEENYHPEASISRGEFISMIVRALGLTSNIKENFDDVRADSRYYQEIAIAKALGIAKGVGNNNYDPDKMITRQDMMVLINRALEISKRLKVKSDISELNRMEDNNKVSEYAKQSIANLVKAGIIQGDGKRIMPKEDTNKASAAVAVYRVLGL